MTQPLIRMTRAGLYCPAGNFHIDPRGSVETALITHAHGDHARSGSDRYLAVHASLPILRKRLGGSSPLEGIAYGQQLDLNGVGVSFHPAGHVLGSAQVRLQYDDQVWVLSGDYKRLPDPTCAPFQVLPCDVFVTEATFALPVYRWQATGEVIDEVRGWWRENRRQGRTSVLFCYALGKAQRILSEMGSVVGDGSIWLHGATHPLVEIYRAQGVAMPPTQPVSTAPQKYDFAGDLVLAPPSAAGSRWMRRFRQPSTGFTSGWMRIRGNRRRRGYDRGFVLSDHTDWPGMLRTIRETGAKRILAMHGRTDVLVRYLNEQGIKAESLREEGAE